VSLLLLVRPLAAAGAPTADPSPQTITVKDRGHTFTAREGSRMSFKLVFVRNADRPAVEAWIFDDDGTLIDFSSGYTWSLKVGVPGSTALLTKTTNIAGAAGAGVCPTGTPNVVITWTAGELNLTPGVYNVQLTATASSLDRVFTGQITILDSIN
jgi:hypothetical protein